MRTIYRWETNGLYMEDRPSVFSLQTVCFSFIRVVCISVLHCQPVKCRYSFVSFCSSLQRDGNMAFSLCIKSKVSKTKVRSSFIDLGRIKQISHICWCTWKTIAFPVIIIIFASQSFWSFYDRVANVQEKPPGALKP